MFWNSKAKQERDELYWLIDRVLLEAQELQYAIQELKEEIDYLSDFVGLDD